MIWRFLSLDDSAWLEAKDRCIMINAADVSDLISIR